jgi:hypothetical protein
MKPYIMSAFLVLSHTVSYSQSTTMENYKIVNVGTISIPSNWSAYLLGHQSVLSAGVPGLKEKP